MRKKYGYFVDNVEMKKKDFMEELKKCCYRVIRTNVVAGWCGVDFVDYDEKQFKCELKSIESGMHVMLPNEYGSKTYKLVYRKEI